MYGTRLMVDENYFFAGPPRKVTQFKVNDGAIDAAGRIHLLSAFVQWAVAHTLSAIVLSRKL